MVKLPDRLAAKVWIRTNQAARRNLTDDQRAHCARQLEKMLAEQEKKARSVAGTDARYGRKKKRKRKKSCLAHTAGAKQEEAEEDQQEQEEEEGRTERSREKAARTYSVSRRKLQQMAYVEKHAPDLAAKVEAGELALGKAVNDTKYGRKPNGSLGAHAAPKEKDRQNKSVVKAAKAGNVSESGVRKALEVRKKAPDLAAKVEAGELALGKAVKTEAWQAEQERIQAEANEKRSKAAKAQPRTPDGKRMAEKQVVEQPVPQPDRHKGKAAKAKASNTNPGAVARGDKLLKERPDLAKQVMAGDMKPAEAYSQAREIFDAMAKERQKAGGGDKKSGVVKVPHPIQDTGQARDHAGKAPEPPGRLPRPSGRTGRRSFNHGPAMRSGAVLDDDVAGGGRAGDRLASGRWGDLVCCLTKARIADKVSA